MTKHTYETKKSYFARVRGRNYRASMRLEGFMVKEPMPGEKSPSKAEILEYYKRPAKA